VLYLRIVSESGREISFKDEHPYNHESPIEETESRMIIFFNDEQSWKQLFPIDVNESENVI
jgi:hypothetical protein